METAEETEYLDLKARCLVVATHEAYTEAAENCADAILIPLFYPESGTFAAHKGIVIIPVCKYDPLDLMYKTENRVEIQSFNTVFVYERFKLLSKDAVVCLLLRLQGLREAYPKRIPRSWVF